MGTTAVFYEWERQQADEVAVDSRKQANQRFFCIETSGMLLPGKSKDFSFTFASDRAGMYSEKWKLKTTPSNVIEGDGAMVCELTGIASRLDESIPARERINARLERRKLETSVRDILRDVVRDVKTPPIVYTAKELEDMAMKAFFVLESPSWHLCNKRND